MRLILRLAISSVMKGTGLGVLPSLCLIIAFLIGISDVAVAKPPPAPPPRRPPLQAATAGFMTVLFNDNFASASPGYLATDLSCAGTPQTAPWKQGLWWEGQNNVNGVAPCSQISIAYDKPSGQNVLDLEWTAAGNTDTYDATTVSTFPLNTYPPHFSFRHGYVEVVARVTPMATGVWPVIWMWSDNSLIETNTPPYASGMPASEMDIMEAYGPTSTSPIGMDSTLHEYYSTEGGGFLFDDYPAPVDVTQPHTYGWLWASDGEQWQGGYVCSYIDNVEQGCANTTAASEAQQMFLILSMGVGCNYNYSDRSCIGSLSRADMYVSRVTVFGQ
jgi:Glycosyl hydrolases family 16